MPFRPLRAEAIRGFPGVFWNSVFAAFCAKRYIKGRFVRFIRARFPRFRANVVLKDLQSAKSSCSRGDSAIEKGPRMASEGLFVPFQPIRSGKAQSLSFPFLWLPDRTLQYRRPWR